MFNLGRFLSAKVGVFTGAMLFATMSQAASYTFQTINDPADNSLQTPVFNQLLGINNSNVIVGYFGDGATIPNNGFIYSGGSFTPANVGGATQTQVVAINNTMTSGAYNTAGFFVDASGANHGFTNIGGSTVYVDGPGSVTTQTLGLNDNHQAVGFYVDANGTTQGFLYNTSTQMLTTLPFGSLGGANGLTATGINNAGTIVGFYSTAAGTISPFIDQGGTFTSPVDPDGSDAMFFGINNSGEIVGSDTANNGATQGLVYNSTTGTWTTVNDPLASVNPNSFGLDGTTLNGINDAGDLVGFYSDASGNVDGLLVTPTPEPKALMLTGAGLGCVLLAWSRRRTSLVSSLRHAG